MIQAVRENDNSIGNAAEMAKVWRGRALLHPTFRLRPSGSFGIMLNLNSDMLPLVLSLVPENRPGAPALRLVDADGVPVRTRIPAANRAMVILFL